MSKTLKLLLVVFVATPLAWLMARLGGWGPGEERLVLLEGGFVAAMIVVVGVLRMCGTGRPVEPAKKAFATRANFIAEDQTSRRYAAGHDMWTGPCSCGAWHKDGK